MVTIFFFGDIFGCNVHGIPHHRFSNSIGIISSIAGVFPQLSIVSQSSISRSTTSSSWLIIQQNHQASFKSEINRTNPESEQYTNEFINSIYQSLTGTQTTKTKGKQKVRHFKSRKTTITNLSSFNLSEAERNLLGRGLNFIPTPTREHPAIILQDYLLFDQKLRLQYYFMDKEKNTTNDKPTTLKQSTGWTPPSSQDQNFDSYRNLTKERF